MLAKTPRVSAPFHSPIDPNAFSRRSRSYPNACVALAGLVVLALIGVGCQTLEREEALPAKVVRIKGAARAGCGTNSWQILKPGVRLFAPGCWVQTAADSYVDVRIGEGPLLPLVRGTSPPIPDARSPKSGIHRLRFMNETVAEFERLTTLRKPGSMRGGVDSIRVSLKAGRCFIQAGELKRGSFLEVRTQRGVARVSTAGEASPDAVFDVSAEGEVRVAEGRVVWIRVDSDEGTGAEIPAGRGYRSGDDKSYMLSPSLMSEVIF